MLSTAFIDLPPLQSAAGEVTLPGSKSISNRVLLLAALCSGRTTIHDLLDSDDTQVMLGALRALGCGLEVTGNTVTVQGMGGQPVNRQAKLFMGNAGTAIRPLTAALAVMGGEFELRGVPRMHERPIGDLPAALPDSRHIEGRLRAAFFVVAGRLGGDRRQVRPAAQDARRARARRTALLMALPLVAKQGVVIEVTGELISRPYIEITLNLLARFNVHVKREAWQRFTIPAGSKLLSPGEVHVEADASSASYFIALGAISTGASGQKSIKVLGVGADSIQGDIRFIDAAQLMGAKVQSGPNWLKVSQGAWPLKAIDLDCNHIPDAAMTLAVMALYADGTTILRNIASWRVKETDRIAAMACELRKLGATVVEGADFIQVTPPGTSSDWRAASIHTYDDHRMAMCFSLAAFNPAGLPVRIEDPKCVAKTFPDYFEALFSLAQADIGAIPVICVDGPTASGKGTLAAALAKNLGYHFLDSGSLYRITALAATRAGIALELTNEQAIAALLQTLPIRFEGNQIWLAHENVSDAIRTEQAGMNASKVSAFPAVRSGLIDLQRSFRKLPGLVADGRDMGTMIFPGAPLKVYLTASAACRAERRHKQLISKGISATLDGLRADLEARDARDSSRSVSPLRPAQDALLLDNSELSVEESVAQVLVWWQSKQPF